MRSNKQSLWPMLLAGIVFLLVGIGLVASEADYIFTGEATNINQALNDQNLEEYHGKYISVNVDAVIDNYAEMTHSTYGIKTGSDQYYLIWLDDGSMISVSIPEKKTSGINRVMDETWEYLSGNASDFTNVPIHIEGELREIGGDLKQYYQECLDYYEITQDEYDIYYYNIDCTSSRGLLIGEMLFFFAVGIGLIALYLNSKAKAKKAQQQAEENSYEYYAGAQQQYHQAQNRGLILSLIARDLCSSRTDLARTSGLSKMSVTNIVGELIESGFVKEIGVMEAGTAGRNPIRLDIAESAPKMIGVVLRRNRCVGVRCDLKMNVLAQKEHYWHGHNNAEILMESICDLIDGLLDESVIGIGVGVVGQPDSRKGMILHPANFYGITNVPVKDLLEERYHLPVFVDNQDSAAATGEIYYGAGKKYQNFTFIGIGSGIGSGVVRDGRVEHNTKGIGTEIGHMSIDYRGKRCNCGNRGCLEMYCGGKAIEERALELTGESASFAEICAQSDEPIYHKILEEMIDHLEIGLVNVINISNPEAIVIGFDGVPFPAELLVELEERINRTKFIGDYYHCPVLTPGYRIAAETIGCAALVAERLFLGELGF